MEIFNNSNNSLGLEIGKQGSSKPKQEILRKFWNKSFPGNETRQKLRLLCVMCGFKLNSPKISPCPDV